MLRFPETCWTSLLSLMPVLKTPIALSHQWNFISMKEEPLKPLLQDQKQMCMNYVCLCTKELYVIVFTITIILYFQSSIPIYVSICLLKLETVPL